MIHFDITTLEKKMQNLQEQTNKSGFWDDIKNSTIVLSELKSVQNKVEKYNKLKENLQNLFDLNELLTLEEDVELIKELLKDTLKLQKQLEELEIETLFSGKYDKNNAILTLHPGARRNRISRLGRNVISNVF